MEEAVIIAPKLVVQALSGCVFLAALSWAGVRAGIITLTTARYFDERTRRQPETEGWKRPGVGVAAGRPFLLASIAAVPALQLLIYSVVLRAIPGPALLATLLVWPAIAILWLVLASRSPWAHFKVALSKAAAARPADRDRALEPVFAADPQLSGEVPTT